MIRRLGRVVVGTPPQQRAVARWVPLWDVARPTMRTCNETAELLHRLLDMFEEGQLDASSEQAARLLRRSRVRS
jgi:hypothetical protein